MASGRREERDALGPSGSSRGKCTFDHECEARRRGQRRRIRTSVQKESNSKGLGKNVGGGLRTEFAFARFAHSFNKIAQH
jgi:hypothetical protein